MAVFHTIQPLFRWAGSKKKLLSELSPYWEKYAPKRYIEPFAGSARLYFHLQPQYAIIGDLNKELINAYRVIQRSPDSLHGYLASLVKDKEHYYEIRAIHPDSLTEVERAGRFLYLNKLCFNGLYRTNLKGEFNVPFSASADSKFPTLDELVQYSALIQAVQFVCGDFEDIVRANLKAGDFIYMDPPYAVQNKDIFHQYGLDTFGIKDIERLAHLLDDIDRGGGHFLLSYAYDESLYDQYFKHWGMKIVSTQRNIAGFLKGRRLANEMLISNG